MILWVLKRNMWNYEYFNEMKSYDLKAMPRGAKFHVLFYSCADEKLLDWARRRRTQMFASYTATLSIVASILAGGIIVQVKKGGHSFLGVWILMMLFFGAYFFLYEKYSKQIQEENKKRFVFPAAAITMIAVSATLLFTLEFDRDFIIAVSVLWALASILLSHSLREEYIHKQVICKWSNELI